MPVTNVLEVGRDNMLQILNCPTVAEDVRDVQLCSSSHDVDVKSVYFITIVDALHAGEMCQYAHGSKQLRVEAAIQAGKLSKVFKCYLCPSWWAGNSCPDEDACYKAHGLQDLRSDPWPLFLMAAFSAESLLEE